MRAFVGGSAYWISDEWECRFAVLNCEQFSGKHTGEYIAAKFEFVLNDWNIPKEYVHVVIRNNAANMVKAFECAELSSFGAVCICCSWRPMTVYSTRSLSQMLGPCRRLVGHFKHSTQASQHLTNIQHELKCDELCPVQDVSTSWNSTFYIDRLLEIKRSVTLFCAETDGMQNKTVDTDLEHVESTKECQSQGDHSPVNVKFPDISLTFCGTLTNAALTRPNPKPCFHLLYQLFVSAHCTNTFRMMQ